MVFPAEATPHRPSIALAGAIAGDAVTDAFDTPELFDVDEDQFAWVLPFIAHHGRPGIKGAVPAQAAPSQHDADGGQPPAEPAGHGRAGQALALAAPRFPLPPAHPAASSFACVSRRAIGLSGLALGVKAVAAIGPHSCAPSSPRARAFAAVVSSRPPGPLRQQHSTTPRRTRILMDVHPGLRDVCWRPRSHSLSAQPRSDNLRSNDTSSLCFIEQFYQSDRFRSD